MKVVNFIIGITVPDCESLIALQGMTSQIESFVESKGYNIYTSYFEEEEK